MTVLRRIVQFLLQYKIFSLAVLTVLVGLTLELLGLHVATAWLLSIVSIFAVIPIITEMWRDLRTGRYGIDILAVTAILASVLLKQYWAGIVIVLMFTGGEALEDFAEHRAKTELDALRSRVPSKATVVRKGKTYDVNVVDIRVGDGIILKPGEVVPADAVISEGSANFDESSLTGESRPQSKSVGDELLSGSVNIDSVVTAKCIRLAKDSQYEQIIKLVRSAAASQAPVVRMADRYAVPFTFAAYSIALAAWYFGHSALRFLEVIVVATPCPLLLAAPIAIISGMSRAAKHGIIIKTGSALEQLASAKTVAFDKTGTLTYGTLSVDKIHVYSPFTEQIVLSLAASLEQNSKHVLAQAIVNKAKQQNVKIPKAKKSKEFAGQGLAATVSAKSVLVGRLDFLKANNVDIRKSRTLSETATHIAIDGQLAGYITFTDSIRQESKVTISRLRLLGIKHIIMVTGDSIVAAKAIAKSLGINDVHAQMLPGDKLHTIEQHKARPIAFVGDGVNDAPVLTASDVGIALGARGSTAASQSADMVIMLDDITRVARVYEIAKRTFKIARQSILGGIALSIILMFVFSTGKFPPLAGAIVQEVVDAIVIFNALRAHGSWAKKRQRITEPIR
jgi:heavy metal translocating P-type ATPase